MTLLRSLLFLIWFYGTSVPLALLYLPTLLMPRRAIMAAIKVWVRLHILGLRAICGIRVEVRGLEHLPKGSALVAAKHQSMFDFMGPFVFLPDVCFVLKQELLNIPVFGWHARKARMIPIDRSGHAKALKELVRDAVERLTEDRQVLIFPEGTRRPPAAPPDYKPGVAALYRELGLPCTPLATNSGVHWENRGVLKRPGTVVFEILPPIPPGLKRSEFMRELEGRIETASDRLLAE